MERTTLFVDVILPLAVPKLYTYRVPFEMNEDVLVGQRVVVQLGRSKLYTAIVHRIHETAPTAYQAKYIDSLLDDVPIVTPEQIAFWEWMARYYMSTIGEVMLAALPGSLKLASETKIVKNHTFDGNFESLDDKEFLIVEALDVRDILTLKEVSEILDQKTVYPIIKRLLEKKAVLVEEELKEGYKPKFKSFIRLAEPVDNDAGLQAAFALLEKRAQKQSDALMAFLHHSNWGKEEINPVEKVKFQKETGASASIINELVKKNIFEIYELEIGRLGKYDGDFNTDKELSDAQEDALLSIEQQFEDKQTVLLHGVTGSGKTEVYIKLIEKYLEKGQQVLYLLPEIALTTQIITRLQKYFGDRVGIYHSKFNQNERVEVWNEVLKGPSGRYDVLLGARSAIFLPFRNLGLVIVDEEHENSFKQYSPSPRYHARDAAIMLAHQQGGKVLLGSATPAVESFWNARQERYGFTELTKRFSGVKLPEVLCADIQKETKRKLMKSHFTSFLLEHMKEALENKEQIILFQNRRGYAPLWSCETCGWSPDCKNCDVSLTYHKYMHLLRCHYCGYNMKPPTSCQACGSTELKMIGFGTEKIEEELELFLPEARVSRMDLETTRSKNAYQNIINDFEERNIDILVGTQMVTKGLDFDNVTLVGVLNADMLLNFPDFRAFERAYQLMSQVAGRAGRKQKRGKVVIQTYNPNHWIIQQVIANDYLKMYQQEVVERRNFKYPPFYRLIEITLKHRDNDLLNVGAEMLAKSLRSKFANRILGPEFPHVARIRNLYHKKIMLKLERKANSRKAKDLLQELLNEFKASSDFKGIRISVDVDPL